MGATILKKRKDKKGRGNKREKMYQMRSKNCPLANLLVAAIFHFPYLLVCANRHFRFFLLCCKSLSKRFETDFKKLHSFFKPSEWALILKLII